MASRQSDWFALLILLDLKKKKNLITYEEKC